MRKVTVFGSLAFLALTVPWLLAGCASDGGGGGSSDDTGVAVDSVSDIPSLNISDYYDTGSDSAGLMSAFKAQTESSGGFCKEFCYNKQCLMETLRHSIQIEFNLCMLRKAKEASGGIFDFPTSGCAEFSVIPPEMEGEGPGGEGPSSGEEPTSEGGPPEGEPPSAVKAKTIEADAPPSDFIVRLCTDGDTKKVHLCDGGELHDELIITNDAASGSINAMVTNRFSFGEDCTDAGQMNITSNCGVDAFSNSECVANFDATFNGCFGAGTINFAVTGGDTRSYDLEASFAAGGAGEDEFGSFSADVKALWDAGGTGSFKSEGSGGFPGIPASEVPVSEIRGCETLASSGASVLCPNDNFDPETYDTAVPVCPFKEASGSTCSFDFADVQCCTISGGTLAEQEGTLADDAVCGAQFTTVSDFPFPAQSTEVNFVDEYDCDPDSTPTSVDIADTAVDFSECFELFAELETLSAESNCEEQGAEEGIEDINEEFAEGGTCTSNSDCASGEKCDIFGGETEGFCVAPPPSCTSDADCVGQCFFEDEECVCAFLDDFGGKACVPVFTCESDDECPPDTTCNVTTGECLF